ncbi:MAG: hypothetical protein ACLP1X_10190 [Polyangiaceae bacterium]
MPKKSTAETSTVNDNQNPTEGENSEPGVEAPTTTDAPIGTNDTSANPPPSDDAAPTKDEQADAPPQSPDPDYATKARSFGRFRLTQNFDEVAGVSQLLVHVSRLKPSPQSWFRTHPDESFRMTVALLTIKDEKSEPYLVAPELVEHVAAEIVPHTLITYITRQKVVGLWPLRLPRGDGKTDGWMRTAHEAANAAMKRWVRMTANMAAGAYDVQVTNAPLAEPEWPDVTFEKLVEIAYRDHIIETLDHPVLRRLRGEV